MTMTEKTILSTIVLAALAMLVLFGGVSDEGRCLRANHIAATGNC